MAYTHRYSIASRRELGFSFDRHSTQTHPKDALDENNATSYFHLVIEGTKLAEAQLVILVAAVSTPSLLRFRKDATVMQNGCNLFSVLDVTGSRTGLEWMRCTDCAEFMGMH